MLQVAGLFVGMVSLGFAVDRIGRKIGSIFTAVVMIIGESFDAQGTAACCDLALTHPMHFVKLHEQRQSSDMQAAVHHPPSDVDITVFHCA